MIPIQAPAGVQKKCIKAATTATPAPAPEPASAGTDETKQNTGGDWEAEVEDKPEERLRGHGLSDCVNRHETELKNLNNRVASLIDQHEHAVGQIKSLGRDNDQLRRVVANQDAQIRGLEAGMREAFARIGHLTGQVNRWQNWESC